MPRGPLRLPRAAVRLALAAMAAALVPGPAVHGAAVAPAADRAAGAQEVRSAPPLLAAPAAQRATRPAPLRLAEALAAPPDATLSPAAVGARDELVALRAWNAGGGRPRQVGFARPLPVPLELRVETSAAWPRRGRLGGGVAARGPAGELVWGARVRVSGAHRLRLRLRLARLPAGAALWVWGAGEAPRPCDLGLRSPAGELWTPSVAGEELMLELALPPAPGGAGRVPARVTLLADAVLELFPRGDAGAGAAGTPAASAAPPCLLDGACAQGASLPGIAAARRAIAHLEIVQDDALVPRAFACTGALLNDRDPATTVPYLLTAAHCVASAGRARTLEAFFDHATPACGAAPRDLAELPRTVGSALLATSAATDVTLLELTELPADRALLGWTTEPLAEGTALHRLSHPTVGDEVLAQSYSRARLDSAAPACAEAPRGPFLYSRLVQGGTLAGSSGAPLLLGDGRVVGQLLGTCLGSAADPCASAGGEVDGAFAASFPLLAAFLDPAPPAPCEPGPAVLCLDHLPADRRFRVEARFATALDPARRGAATAVPLGPSGMPSAGLFWFFAADNPELLVKVLDGCAANGRHWLFAAAATNTAFTLEVLDTATGRRRTYTNADLAPAAPVLDSGAFPCGEAGLP